jgi:hypothetical protein
LIESNDLEQLGVENLQIKILAVAALNFLDAGVE